MLDSGHVQLVIYLQFGIPSPHLHTEFAKSYFADRKNKTAYTSPGNPHIMSIEYRFVSLFKLLDRTGK